MQLKDLLQGDRFKYAPHTELSSEIIYQCIEQKTNNLTVYACLDSDIIYHNLSEYDVIKLPTMWETLEQQIANVFK